MVIRILKELSEKSNKELASLKMDIGTTKKEPVRNEELHHLK